MQDHGGIDICDCKSAAVLPGAWKSGRVCARIRRGSGICKLMAEDTACGGRRGVSDGRRNLNARDCGDSGHEHGGRRVRSAEEAVCEHDTGEEG
jgi:hypothetical protein